VTTSSLRSTPTNKAPFKRYIAFGIAHYYPSGGVDDIVGSADTIDEARVFNVEERDGKTYEQHDTFYIVDRDTWEIVE
jgi:hypothetical protein